MHNIGTRQWDEVKIQIISDLDRANPVLNTRVQLADFSGQIEEKYIV